MGGGGGDEEEGSVRGWLNCWEFSLMERCAKPISVPEENCREKNQMSSFGKGRHH